MAVEAVKVLSFSEENPMGGPRANRFSIESDS